MLVTFRIAAAAGILASLACIVAAPELAGWFAGAALLTEAIRLAVAFLGNRL